MEIWDAKTNEKQMLCHLYEQQFKKGLKNSAWKQDW